MLNEDDGELKQEAVVVVVVVEIVVVFAVGIVACWHRSWYRCWG